MDGSRSSRSARLVLYGSLVLVGLLSLGRVLQYDPVPLGWVGAFAAAAAVVAGPVTWVVRDRLPEARRERLTLVAFVAAMLAVPVLLGVGLLAGTLPFFVDVGVFGGLVGFAVATAVERTLVPERLRSEST